VRQKLLSGFLVSIASAAALISCGGSSYSSSSTAPTPTNATANVTIAINSSAGNTAFNPNPVAATAGDMVVFKNNDSTMHHIVMNDGSADFGDIAPGATSRAMAAPSKAGNYHCTIHPTMVGTINGDKAPDAPPCTNPGYCD
jgi:plastocyanin